MARLLVSSVSIVEREFARGLFGNCWRGVKYSFKDAGFTIFEAVKPAAKVAAHSLAGRDFSLFCQEAFSNLLISYSLEGVLSPTVFRAYGFRFCFFSREESRMHIHVHGHSGEAKFWVEPSIDLAQSHGLSEKELKLVRRLIEDHEDDIRNAWFAHFGG